MNAHDDGNWTPDPQLLAAYFDGELEGHAEMAEVRARLEAWLDRHPEAAGERSEHQLLQKVWLDTAPCEPGPATWNAVRAKIEAERRQPSAPAAAYKRHWASIGLVAASVLLIFGLAALVQRYTRPQANVPDQVVQAPKVQPTLAEVVEVLPVATADEIVVYFIEGADTHAVVVGQLPVQGPLLLADVGDVRVFAVRSDGGNKLLPHIGQDGPNRPMIWMPLETE